MPKVRETKSIARITAERYYGVDVAKQYHTALKAGEVVTLKVAWRPTPTRMWWYAKRDYSLDPDAARRQKYCAVPGGPNTGGSPRHVYLNDETIYHMEARSTGFGLNENEFLWACLAACASDQIDLITRGIPCVSFWAEGDPLPLIYRYRR